MAPLKRKPPSGVRLNIDNPTNQIAELTAGFYALRRAMLLAKRGLLTEDDEGKQLSMVVIKSDSEYLVKGMTQWILKWKKNGFRNAKGAPVVNAELFQKLEQAYQELIGLGIYTFFLACSPGTESGSGSVGEQRF
uniref:ribonuclease H n=1 Tax=Talaromyces marneffei PM1 TaxID=1077442 RepID=A0A093UR09_TALMA